MMQPKSITIIALFLMASLAFIYFGWPHRTGESVPLACNRVVIHYLDGSTRSVDSSSQLSLSVVDNSNKAISCITFQPILRVKYEGNLVWWNLACYPFVTCDGTSLNTWGVENPAHLPSDVDIPIDLTGVSPFGNDAPLYAGTKQGMITAADIKAWDNGAYGTHTIAIQCDVYLEVKFENGETDAKRASSVALIRVGVNTDNSVQSLSVVVSSSTVG